MRAETQFCVGVVSVD